MESSKQNNVVNNIQETRKLFNQIRSNLSRNEVNRIREKLHKKEVIYNHLKEQEDSLTNKEKKVLMNRGRYPKNIAKHLKSLKKHFKKSQNYQYGLDYLVNEHNEEGYTSNNVINVIVDVRNTLNEHRNNLLLDETKRIRKKLHKKETIYNVLKDKEQKGSLTNDEKKKHQRKSIGILRILKNIQKNYKKINIILHME